MIDVCRNYSIRGFCDWLATQQIVDKLSCAGVDFWGRVASASGPDRRFIFGDKDDHSLLHTWINTYVDWNHKCAGRNSIMSWYQIIGEIIALSEVRRDFCYSPEWSHCITTDFHSKADEFQFHAKERRKQSESFEMMCVWGGHFFSVPELLLQLKFASLLTQ
jgi:hypothetical protein